MTSHKIQVQHKKHKTISVSTDFFSNTKSAYKDEMSDIIDISTFDLSALTDIAHAFRLAVLQSNAYEKRRNIKVGFVGAPEIGKSTFSDGFQKSLQHAPPRVVMKRATHGQFYYKSVDHMSVQRVDLATLSKNHLEHIKFRDDKHLYLIEHSDLKKSLQCHVLVGIKSPRPMLVTTDDTGLSGSLNSEINNLNNTAPENSRHIRISYQDNYFNRQDFEGALEQIMQQPHGSRWL